MAALRLGQKVQQYEAESVQLRKQTQYLKADGQNKGKSPIQREVDTAVANGENPLLQALEDS
jgi:hypothetical protein